MVFKMTGMDLIDGIPGYTQEIGRVFQGHAPLQADYIFRETVGVTATARGQGDALLTVITAILILALIALDFHTIITFSPPTGSPIKLRVRKLFLTN